MIIQLFLIIVCAAVICEWAINFPYPSPLIQPFLEPKLRWPTDEVKKWIESQTIDLAFQRFFYRDPDRRVPSGHNLVAPADGRIQKIAYHDGITYLVIGLSFWDVHVVRTPIAGVVKSIEREGAYYDRNPTRAGYDQSLFLRGKAAPVQQIVSIKTELGEVLVRLITSYWASRIKIWVHPGERLSKGERIGRILLGSTVVMELPGQFEFNVKYMQHVTGGETILGEDEPIK